MAEEKSLHRMPVADCGVFEVGERSEVGALESLCKTLAQRATNAKPKTLAQRSHQREAQNAKPKTLA